MKTKVYLIVAVAWLFGACSTGTYVTTRYVDDVYFNPADIPPPVAVEEPGQAEQKPDVQGTERLIISEIKENPEGSKTMNNYVFDGKDAGQYANVQRYNMEQMDLQQSDTTVYYDDNDIKYVINNYYNGSDMDFGYRIQRFHRPFFYDPFSWHDWYWDSWYYPYYSWGWDPWFDWGWNWGWGYSPMYSSWYGGYYGGWYGGMYGGMYGGWYSPYSYWGWGGYGYPYYGSWYGYGNYWGGGNFNREDYRYGQRRDYNTTVFGGGGRGSTGSRAEMAGDRTPVKSATPGATGSSLNEAGRRGGSISGAAGGGRDARTGSGTAGTGQGRTLTEMRRSTQSNTPSGSRTGSLSRSSDPSAPVGGQSVTRQYTRPSSFTREPAQGNTNNYSPTYNQQRSSTRSNYNVQGNRPSTNMGSSGEMKSGQRTPTTVYSRPSSSSSSDRVYRSGSTYNRSSVSGENSGRSYSVPSQSSRDSYSSPSRGSSYSSPSYSSPSYGGSGSSGSSGGYSGGSSVSGGGSGGQSSGGGGSTSHSGRR